MFHNITEFYVGVLILIATITSKSLFIRAFTKIHKFLLAVKIIRMRDLYYNSGIPYYHYLGEETKPSIDHPCAKCFIGLQVNLLTGMYYICPNCKSVHYIIIGKKVYIIDEFLFKMIQLTGKYSFPYRLQ